MMDLAPSAEMVEVGDSFERMLAKECPPTRVRDAEPVGFDAALWARFVELGAPTMGVPVERGGGGADLQMLAYVAERVGRHLAPVPFVEAAVATRLLTGAGVELDEVGDGVATLALRPATDGTTRLAPAGAVADHIVALDGEALVLAGSPPVAPVHLPNLGSLPLADRPVREPGAVVRHLGHGPRVVASFERAVDEWRVLTSAALVGLAERALAIGVEYAKGRHQFGVPIGSFQGVAHPLADDSTGLEGARLLTYEAAWAADEGRPEAAALATMAFLFSAETAARTCYDALHVHGGYGYMLEYDIQLYFRRAKGWALVAGDMPAGYEHLATLLYGPRSEV
jgi:alkylation response protein AidB-like acyl-CoA dehydrogenase